MWQCKCIWYEETGSCVFLAIEQWTLSRCLWNVSFSFLASSGSLTIHPLWEARSTEGQQSILFAAGCRELKMVRCSWYTYMLPLVAQRCTLNVIWACAFKRSWKLKNGRSLHQQNSFVPLKTLLLKILVSGPAFNSLTSWHHTSHVTMFT